jgi:6-pyruvoyltetrahydropterin/6-carboxytetrahydropterin synthase
LIFVTRKAHFNAAHRLHNPDRSEQWNQEKFGKCNNPYWHGHNYQLEVTVAGEPDPETGYVIDLGVLKSIIQRRILDPCDHKNLNLEVDFLQGVIPSSENLVRVFFQQLEAEINQEAFGSSRLYSVKLYETDRNIAEYRSALK